MSWKIIALIALDVLMIGIPLVWIVYVIWALVWSNVKTKIQIEAMNDFADFQEGWRKREREIIQQYSTSKTEVKDISAAIVGLDGKEVRNKDGV